MEIALFVLEKNYLLIKYEDLVKSSKDEFTRIAEFVGNLLNLNFTSDQIETAINLSSFERLDEMEKKSGFTESTVDKNGNKNKFFFLGPKNNWQKILDKKISNEISTKFENEMKELGYL